MCVVRYLAPPRWTGECYCAAMPTGISTMRLFTGFAGSQRVLTLNATDVQEAKDALTMLGVTGDGSLIIRRAMPDEAACWRASAMEAGTL